MAELSGYLMTHEDWYAFASVAPTPGLRISDPDHEDVATWLSQFPDGCRVTITVDDQEDQGHA